MSDREEFRGRGLAGDLPPFPALFPSGAKCEGRLEGLAGFVACWWLSSGGGVVPGGEGLWPPDGRTDGRSLSLFQGPRGQRGPRGATGKFGAKVSLMVTVMGDSEEVDCSWIWRFHVGKEGKVDRFSKSERKIWRGKEANCTYRLGICA